MIRRIGPLTFLFLVNSVFANEFKAPQRPSSTMESLRRQQDQALLKGKQEKELKNELLALELILNNKLRKDGKNELLLRRAFIYFKIGRARMLSNANTKTPKTEFFKEASSAIQELVQLSKNKDIVLTPSQQALLLFIRGSISQELGREKDYMDDFAIAIKIDPKLPQSASMALILGETYFDKDKYKDAIAWYQKLKNQYEPHQKSIADFKTGWSWLLLKEPKNAQFYFLRVANQNMTDSFRDESVKALAFIIAQNRNERWIVEFAKKSLIDENLRLLFLSAVIQNVHNIDKTKVPYLLFSELYKRTKDPSAKIKVLGQLIAFERREIPTLGQKRAFEYLESLVKKNPQLSWRKWMTELLDLETDMRNYIQILSDHYVGKIPAKLDLDKTQIVDLLNREIQFYVTYLMNENTKKPMMNLWIDLIHREQNVAMSLQAIEVLKQIQPALPGELKRARLEYIAILDGQLEKNPEARKTLIADIEDFVKTYPQDEDKSRLLSRLAELYMLDEQFEKALPALQELLALQPNENNAYNVLWSLFKLEKYPEVVTSEVGQKFSKNSKIQEVLRESHLKLAQEAQKSGDQAAYEGNLKKFLSLNPKADQIYLVKGSLVSSLLEKKNLVSYCQERASMSEKEKNSEAIISTEEKALDQMFLEGPLVNCHWSTKKGPQSRDFKLMLYERSRSRALPKDFEKNIWKFSVDQQAIMLGLLAVVDPKKVVDLKPPRKMPEELKGIYWLALQLSQGKKQPVSPPHLEGVFQKAGSPQKAYKTTSNIPKIIKEAVMPSAKMSVERYSKYLEDLIYRSKLVKTRFSKEAPDAADEIKKTVLEMAAEFERKIGSSIRNSPVPKGLQEAEIANYKSELEKAALDFDRQAEEYDKALGDLKGQMWVREQEANNARVPKMSVDDWFWEGDEKELLQKSMKEYGPFYTLLKLETSRAQKVLSDLDYIRRRSGTLLMIRNDEIQRTLIRDELTAFGAQSLLEKWKEIK